MFLTTKKGQLQIVPQRKRSYKCSFPQTVKRVRFLHGKTQKFFNLAREKKNKTKKTAKLLKCPHSFQNKCKLHCNTLLSSVPAESPEKLPQNVRAPPYLLLPARWYWWQSATLLASLLPITNNKMAVSLETSPLSHEENYQLFLIRALIRVYLFTEMFLSYRRHMSLCHHKMWVSSMSSFLCWI